MTDLLELIGSWINSPDLQRTLWPVKTLFILVTLGLLAVASISLKKSSYFKVNFLQEFKEYWGYRPFGHDRREKDWKSRVLSRLERQDPAEYKLAILEADKILDQVLQRMGYGGETREDRIEKVPDVAIPTIGEVRNAHRIHNNIVQDPMYLLSETETKRIIQIYETALKGLD
ncbi:MAG: hypothetical protein Q8P70_02040, partial [bacterium]|nr:hypothetical protein [bacterium]